MLIADYENFYNSLCDSKDEIVRSIANIMSIAHEYLLFTYSIATWDSITIKHILNKWLPIWKAGGKSNYTELLMANMGILNSEMTHIDLEGMRIN